MAYDLGIDVGTSYTAAAVRSDDGSVQVVGLGPIADSIPTVLYLNDDGTMVVGDAANRKALLDGSGAAREFKRRLGDPTPLFLRGSPFSAEALMARMFRYVIERVEDQEGRPPRRIAVSHPANWGAFKMDIFGHALQMAGLDDVTLISEPAAAAIAYAAETRMTVGSTIAVYDLGGGTFDAAVLRKTADGFDIVGEPVGLEHVGGMDFDSAVLDFIRTNSGIEWDLDPDDAEHVTAMSHLRRSCVEAKELLSSESEAQIAVLLPGVEDSVRLQRATFESKIRPILVTTIEATERAIAKASLSPADLSAILLVGGSSRIPLVAQLLSERFGELVRVDIDPVHAAAKGAALAAVALAGPADLVTEPTMPVRPGPGPSAQGPSGLPPPPWLADDAALPRAATPPAVAPPALAGPANVAPPAVAPPAVAPPAVAPPAVVPLRIAPPKVGPSAPSAPAPAPVPTSSAGLPGNGVAGAPAPTNGTDLKLVTTDRASSPQRSKLALIGVPVALVLAIGGLAFALTRGGDGGSTGDPLDASGEPAGSATGDDQSEGGTPAGADTDSGDTDSGEAAPAVLGTARSAPADGMIEVPAGTYPLGLDQPEANTSESLSAIVELPTFYIGAFEVSNAEYKAFVDQTGAEPPASWRGGAYPEELAEHPVEGVSFAWATAFCQASSRRLPTEAEWEAAARGAEARIWPWGDERDAVKLPDFGTYPVGSVPGNVSPFGAFDMVGNVWEWVADSYDQRVGSDLRVLRGGQNGFLRETVTRLPVDPVRSSALRTAGFRCAADGLDPNATVGAFLDYDRPERPNEPEVVPLPVGVAVYDDFSDSTSGWTELTVAGEFRRGYHPNEYLHLETQAPMAEALALGPWRSSPGQRYALLTSAFVEPSLTTPEGTFATGLAFHFDDSGRGLVFMVDERTSTWRLASREPNGQGPYGADGAEYVVIEESTRSIPAQVDLEVVDLGEGNFQFKIGGSVVHTRTIPGYDGTANGLVLISFEDSAKVHIHFEEFQVNDVG